MNIFYEKLELGKILRLVADYATLSDTKTYLSLLEPQNTIEEVRQSLDMCEEAFSLLYDHGIGKIEFFEDPEDIMKKSSKGAILTFAELLNAGNFLRSSRIAYSSIKNVNDEKIVLLKNIANNIYFDERLEDDITTKILNENTIADNASERLFQIRRDIRLLNDKIKVRLQESLQGENAKFLQDGIITMRGDRYVLPVKAEYKSRIRGFVHDRSATGATLFIEPDYILEMNNELKTLYIDEHEEIERILKDLSNRFGANVNRMQNNMTALLILDSFYARAEYSFKHRSIKPQINSRGEIDIIKGRHPLIDDKKVVPVSLSLGERYRYLLISGPNTGGKTVTLKLVGLLTLMAECGLFVPCQTGTKLSVFDEVFCDIGDSQSIEENLSTFSSHIKNIIDITERVTSRSLVLIDEIGGGTDPEEGQALAKAVTEHLIDRGSFGIITTHYTSLKEFAYEKGSIENACMEFDSTTLQPLYRIKIGLSGSSNALAISKKLGLNPQILERAYASMNEGALAFDNIVQKAEESRVKAQQALEESERLKAEWSEKVESAKKEYEKYVKEREKVTLSARAETKKIVAERTEQAEELLAQIEEIFQKEEISQTDLFKARTLKNKLSDSRYLVDDEERQKTEYKQATPETLREGDEVFVERLGTKGKVVAVRAKKNEAEIVCGSIKTHHKIDELLIVPKTSEPKQKKKVQSVKVVNKTNSINEAPLLEINLLGMTVMEAIQEIDVFIDRAVLSNLEQIKIVHGFGTGRLKEGIHQHLRKHKNVESFRLGVYGEGEAGVTIVTLK